VVVWHSFTIWLAKNHSDAFEFVHSTVGVSLVFFPDTVYEPYLA